MLILDSTTDTIRIRLSVATTSSPVTFYGSYRTTNSSSILPKNSYGTITSGSTDIIPAPASGEQNIVDYISAHNGDTVAATVFISLFDGTSQLTLFTTTLGPGEKLEYVEGQGFKVFTNAGSVKTSVNQGTSPVGSNTNQVILSADVVNSNVVANTLADVTGLSFPVLTGNVYSFRFVIFYSSANAATGSRWTINGPAFSQLGYTSDYALTATSRTTNNATAYQIPVAANATSATTTGNVAVIVGFIKPSADGTVVAQFASETSLVAITALAGSLVDYKQVI
jgi:hypothetical protein